MNDLETFLTRLDVMVDEVYKRHQLCSPKHPGPAPRLSLSERIALVLFGQGSRFSRERTFSCSAKRHLRQAFPTLPDRSQFLRQEPFCVSLIEQVACLLAEQRPQPDEGLSHILDATGVPVRCIKRYESSWLAGTANQGWCSRISSSMGFHVLLAIPASGFLTGFGFSPASVHDIRLAQTIVGLRHHPSARLSRVGRAFPMIADLPASQCSSPGSTTFGRQSWLSPILGNLSPNRLLADNAGCIPFAR